MAAGHAPGQGGAPVVPGQVEPFRPGRISQGEHVRRQLGVPVRGPGGRPGPGTIAAQAGRQDPGAAPGKRGRHPVPAAAVLRKPVQEDGDAVRRLDLDSAAPHGAVPGPSRGDRPRRSGGGPGDPGATANTIDLTCPGQPRQLG